MRPLSLLTWNDKKRTRLLMSGLLAAAAATASGTVAAAATPIFSGPPVRIIVRAEPGQLAAADAEVAAAAGHVLEQIPLISASVAEVPQGAIGWLGAEPGIAALTPDGQVRLLSSSYSPTTDPGSLYTIEKELGVTQAWQDGYTGAGVGVALIDTGVSPVQGLDSPGQVVNGPDLSFDAPSPSLRYLDENGHGTFMAGIIAGNDLGAGNGPAYAADTTDFLGIAPDAHVVNVKVGSANGAVDVSQVLAAIDWVVQHRNDGGLNIRVLNLSFGTDSNQPYLVDPLAYAAEQAWHQGVVVVAAAGNQGSAAGGLADPADDPYVIAVGASQPALNGGFAVAPFSNSGSSGRGPDLIAPGKSIVSLADPGSVIDDQYAATGAVGARFFRGSGTSEATAVVSGLAALLIQEHPAATPDQIKALMTTTAVSVTGGALVTATAAPAAWAVLAAAGALSSVAGSGEVMASAAVQAGLPTSTQSFPDSQGTGSLEGSRGSLRVTLLGTPLTGNEDIFGDPVNTASLAVQEGQADSWSGGTWNGATWSGGGWVWASGTRQWAYAPWTARTWVGLPWWVTLDSGTWSGTSWSGTSWSGTSWSGTSWSGTSWSGTSWSGTSWSGTSWSGISWSAVSWSAVSWSGTSWSDGTWSTVSWS